MRTESCFPRKDVARGLVDVHAQFARESITTLSLAHLCSRGRGWIHTRSLINIEKILNRPITKFYSGYELMWLWHSWWYSQGKTLFYSIQYKNGCFWPLFYIMFTQSIKLFTFYYHILKVQILKQIFWKMITFFKKLEYHFLVESAKNENTLFPCKTAISGANINTNRTVNIK